MTEATLSSLLEIDNVRRMMSALSGITGLELGLHDASSRIELIRFENQNICSLFHLISESSRNRCDQHYRQLSERLGEGEPCNRKCENGIWQILVPVMVRGNHIATVHCSLFLLQEEKRTRELYFRSQAQEHGFEPDLYLQAVANLPVFSNEQVYHLTEYNRAFAQFLGNQAERTLVMASTAKALNDSHSRYRELFNSARFGILLADSESRIIDVNPRMTELTGYAKDELCSFAVAELIDVLPKASTQAAAGPGGNGNGGSLVIEGILNTRVDEYIPVEVNRFISPETGYHTVLIQDIRQRKRAEERVIRAQCELEEKVKERTASLSVMVETLKRRNLESEAISKTSELLQACETEEESYTIISSLCRQLFPDNSGFLAAYDEESEVIRVVSTFGNVVGAQSEFEIRECWALRRGAPHLVQNPEEEPLCIHAQDDVPLASLCVPVGSKSEFLGLLHIRWPPLEKDGDGVTETLATLAKRVVELYALSLSNIRLRSRLRLQSIRDPLTSLYNRRYLDDTLRREVARARRNSCSVGIILMDVDNFKKINDMYGHEVGDEVLRKIGVLLQETTRDEDIPCRFGGEEFVLILPDCTPDTSIRRAEEIRRGVEDLQVFSQGKLIKVTMSLGVASFPENGSNQAEVIMMADTAMYKAKQAGRNLVRIANSTVE